VCCTGGEEGDLHNPALAEPGGPLHGLDGDALAAGIAALRPAELDASAAAIGFDEVIMLGYRDSGMAGCEANENPDCFAAADLDEATERLVSILRSECPDVVLTYGDPAFYGKSGFVPADPATLPAPYPLSMPQGWQGLALAGGALPVLQGPCRCVAPFENAGLW